MSPEPTVLTTDAWMRAIAMLSLDGLALKVIDALETQGVPVLLLKGPVTGSWLFDDVRSHPYSDVDLLVAPSDVRAAGAVLASLGLTYFHAGVLGVYRPRQERAWTCPEGMVDLHKGLSGIPEALAEKAWHRFDSHAVPFVLHGHRVRSLDEVAKTLQLAIHAAQPGANDRPRADLVRGLAVLPERTWRDAAALAAELCAMAAFTAGLATLPQGRQLLAALELAEVHTATTVLAKRGCLAEALSLAALAEAPRHRRWQALRGWLSVEAGPQDRALTTSVARVRVIARLPFAAGQLAIAAGLARWRTRRATGRPRSRGGRGSPTAPVS